jgi:hypothetical protein
VDDDEQPPVGGDRGRSRSQRAVAVEVDRRLEVQGIDEVERTGWERVGEVVLLEVDSVGDAERDGAGGGALQRRGGDVDGRDGPAVASEPDRVVAQGAAEIERPARLQAGRDARENRVRDAGRGAAACLVDALPERDRVGWSVAFDVHLPHDEPDGRALPSPVARTASPRG